ncbi:MAG: molybdopterin-dependent oxidoreductase, partial [Desulfobacterales bacterium]|nr:molybdopterin-dependent oxidoreductase [Desulfobacterales bacterium]
MNLDFVLTTCPFCGCGCQFYLQILDGEISGVIPCKTDEVSEGKLCIKGRNAHRFVQHKDRLKKPLIKQDGKLKETGWQKAFDIIGKRLGEIKRDFGPDSIGLLSSAKCTNEENFLFMKFARAAIGTNNIDHCARLCHASTVVGLMSAFGSGAMTNSIPEVEGAECIFVIGSNTIEQHPMIGSRIVKAKDKGAKLIVADPRRIPLAGFADIYLQMKPGTDVCLLNGLMNIILKEGLEDKDFIGQRTEGSDEFRKNIELYPPEKVQEICDIGVEDLRKAARMYGEARRAMIIYSMGITQHTTGTDNVKSTANLALLTGNVGRECTG